MFRSINALRRVSLILLLAGYAGLALAEIRLEAQDAWVREGPPNSRVLAGFMGLSNPTGEDAVITAVASPDFGRIEMHKTEMQDGVARMLRQDRIVVPAGGTVSLEPGGMHLMLFDPTHPIKAGGQVSFELSLANGATVPVQASVRKGGMGDAHQHHRHH